MQTLNRNGCAIVLAPLICNFRKPTLRFEKVNFRPKRATPTANSHCGSTKSVLSKIHNSENVYFPFGLAVCPKCDKSTLNDKEHLADLLKIQKYQTFLITSRHHFELH